MVHLLLVHDLLLQRLVQLIPLGLLNLLLRSEPPKLIGELIVLSQNPLESLSEVALLLLVVDHFRLEVLDLFVVLELEVGQELPLLGLQLLLRLLFVLTILARQDFDFGLEGNDLFFVVADLARELVFEVIDEGLPTLQLALALLVVDAQVLVLDLDLVEEALDLAEVVGVVLLGQSVAESLDLFLQPLVLQL